jgi:uncharacterized membrane protein
MQNRWKSPILWTSMAALIFFVVKNWIGWEIPNWDEFVTLLVAALVAFGVVNSPDNKDSL